MKIIVLMSTYNGQKYVAEQIESILNQQGVDLVLLIRDDGSSDGTRSILEQYRNKYSNIDLRLEDNIGCKASFYKLAEIAYKEYPENSIYAFSDQDDVWDKDKLKSAMDCYEKNDQNKPFLYGSNYRLVDSELNIITVPEKKSMTLCDSLFFNNVIGCTMVFNRELLRFFLMATPDMMYLHDSWIIRTCFAIGGTFVFDQTPRMNYRQHNNNVVGGSRTRISRLCSFFSGYDYDVYEVNMNIRYVYYKYLTVEADKILKLFYEYRLNFVNKFRLIRNLKFNTTSLSSLLKLYIYIYI